MSIERRPSCFFSYTTSTRALKIENPSGIHPVVIRRIAGGWLYHFGPLLVSLILSFSFFSKKIGEEDKNLTQRPAYLLHLFRVVNVVSHHHNSKKRERDMLKGRKEGSYLL